MKLEISSKTDFSKNTQMSEFIKIILVEAEVIHADGRTDEQT
jgi:hypothetical protein